MITILPLKPYLMVKFYRDYGYMPTALQNACAGLSKAKGGLNVSDLKDLAKSQGHTNISKMKRDELITLLCGTQPVVAKTVKATAVKTAVSPKPYGAKTIAPKLPRGEVGVRTEAWKDRKPKSKGDRRDLLQRCGDKCFLIPDELKYPICSSKGDCSYDCDGLRAGRNLTYLINNRKTVGEEAKDRAIHARILADKLGKQHCGWK